MSSEVELSPNDELLMTLSSLDRPTPTKATLSIGHGGQSYLAFKVKTTNPRRYIVSPSQGLIRPGGSAQLQLVMEEADHILLRQSFDKHGPCALDVIHDRFMIQTTLVNENDEMGEQLLMASKSSEDDDTDVSRYWGHVVQTNKSSISGTKISVRLLAEASQDKDDRSTKSWGRGFWKRIGVGRRQRQQNSQRDGSTDDNSSSTTSSLFDRDPALMTTEQLRVEVTRLREKYKDLVSLSQHVTDERDMLSNALDLLKREPKKCAICSSDKKKKKRGDGDTGSSDSTPVHSNKQLQQKPAAAASSKETARRGRDDDSRSYFLV